LVPERQPVQYTPAANLITVGPHTAQIERAEDSDANEAVLEAYLTLVADARDVSRHGRFDLRFDDVEILAQLLHLDDAELDQRLARMLGIEVGAAREVHSRMARHRKLFGAASLALLSSLPFVHDRPSSNVSTEKRPVEIGAAMVVWRAQQPADPGVQLGDVYSYER
jgi:hypothetical protein